MVQRRSSMSEEELRLGRRAVGPLPQHIVQQHSVQTDLVQRQLIDTEGVPTQRGSAADVTEFVEATSRFWATSRETIQHLQVSPDLMTRLLENWLRMMNQGWRLIDERLGGRPALLQRLKDAYRSTVDALFTKASSDLGIPEQQLYAQYNRQIAWWARRQLAPREDIVFILGSGDNFYGAATRYFRFVGARIVGNQRTLLGVRDWLAANPPANGLPWGDVNIVVHANLEGQMMADVEPDGDRVSPRTLRAAIENNSFRALSNSVVDDATRLVIRGCALGRNQEILQLLRSGFGGNDESPQVYAPVHLQEYSYRSRRGRTISAEESFLEFWYVGFPSSPALNRRQLVDRFEERYPNEDVDWARSLRASGGTRRHTYSFTYTIEQAHEAPPAGRQGRRALARLIRSRLEDARDAAAIRETARSVSPDGTISIRFSYQIGPQQYTGSMDGLLPRMRNQREYRAFLGQQQGLMNSTRPLEEGANLGADDFFWALRRVRNRGGASSNYEFTGGRTLLRIQQRLVEPDPARPGRTRPVRPDLSDTSQYGREMPENY